MKTIGLVLSMLAVTAFIMPVNADVIRKKEPIPKKHIAVEKKILTDSEIEVIKAKCTAADLQYFSQNPDRLQVAAGNTLEEILAATGLIILAGAAIIFVIKAAKSQ